MLPVVKTVQCSKLQFIVFSGFIAFIVFIGFIGELVNRWIGQWGNGHLKLKTYNFIYFLISYFLTFNVFNLSVSWFPIHPFTDSPFHFITPSLHNYESYDRIILNQYGKVIQDDNFTLANNCVEYTRLVFF